MKIQTLTLALALTVLPLAASAKSNETFLNDAIQTNLAEISIGDLAQQNGGSDAVKSFGQMLVKDHTASNQKAEALAQAQGITPPTKPSPEAQKEHDALAKLSGSEFDKKFAAAMVKGHKEAIGKFDQEAKGTDDVAKFAKETLPTLQEHLKTAQSLAAA